MPRQVFPAKMPRKLTKKIRRKAFRKKIFEPFPLPPMEPKGTERAPGEPEPRVPLIPGVGLPGHSHDADEPQPGPSGLQRRRPRTRSLPVSRLSSTDESTSSRSHSLTSMEESSSEEEVAKESVFDENMSFEEVIQILYKRYRKDDYVRKTAVRRLVKETGRTAEDIEKLVDALPPEEQ